MNLLPETDDRHVHDSDLDGLVPLTAHEETRMNHEPAPSLRPTRKWFAALTGAAASVIASWVVTGAFDDVERGMCGAAIVSLAAAYWRNNDPTPGGVPERV